MTPAFQSLDLPVGLNSRDLSNGDGASLAIHEREFSSSDEESLPEEHSKDIPSSDRISPTMPTSDGLQWTLNF